MSTGNYSGYDKVDLKKVVNEDGDDVTASFDIATPIDLSQNGTAVAGTISMVGTPAAGDYTATIATQDTTTDPVYATVEFTIARGTHKTANNFDVEGDLSSAAPAVDGDVADLVTNVTAGNTDNWNVTGWSLKVNDVDASTMADGEKFVSDQVVTLEIAIECAENYVFADGLSVTKALGGISNPIVSLADDNLTATITYTWTVA